MRVLGIILIALGILLTLSLIFAGIGITLIVLGIIAWALSRQHRFQAQNVMHVVRLIGAGVPRGGAGQAGRHSGIRPDGEAVVRSANDSVALGLETDLFHEDERHFVDPRSELSQDARKILLQARTAGYHVKTRADAVVVRNGSDERLFFSNAAILDFGRATGLADDGPQPS